MKKFCFIFSLALLSKLCALESDETKILEQILDEATEIATKTKLNADYVPGSVTVITGEKLKSLGITNLSDPIAFDMIVGFDSPVKSLRGAGAIYGSQGNKIKWMINDKPVSSEIWGMPKLGVGQIAFPIPVDSIDRIEIITGPGSAIYGGNAIYGVINIVTKKAINSVFSSISRMENNSLGKSLGANFYFKEDDLSLFAVASTMRSSGWDLGVKSQTAISSTTNLPSSSGGDIFMLEGAYKNISFWAYNVKSFGDYASFQWDPTNYIPNTSKTGLQSSSYVMLGVQSKWAINDSSSVSLRSGVNQYRNNADGVLFYPSSVLGSAYDGLRSIAYLESTKYIDGLIESKLPGHRLLFGAYASLLTVDKDNVIQSWGYDSSWNLIYKPPYLTSLLTTKNPSRSQKAFYAQDEINVGRKVTVTVGARVDRYSDASDAMSPRAALVYRYDDSNILKMQYARAFRPASFSEQYSPNNTVSRVYKPETVDTVEGSYIYKDKDLNFRTTIFSSTTYNMITFHDYTYETINLQKPTSTSGVEFEIKMNTDSNSFGLNFSHYNTHRGRVVADLGNGSPNYFNYDSSSFALVAENVLNIFAIFNKDWLYPTTVWYHYTGSKKRVNNALLDGSGNIRGIYTTNGSVDAQDYLNITQKIKGLAKGFELDFGVKNAFGKTLRTLYYPLNPPNSQDVPYMRQTIWVNALYKF